MSLKGPPSFERFNYLLRPSKQVERKLLVEAMHKLSMGGFRIPEYTYFGLGSVYYADFILFHKYLYIDKMICVEGRDIPKRMLFNKPFEFIHLEMKLVGEVIPTLDREIPYFAWMDYEDYLNREILADVAGLVHVLSPGSVLIITVDADPRVQEDGISDETCRERRVDHLVESFSRELGRYHAGDIRRSVISRAGLPTFFASVLRSHLAEEVAKRDKLKFHQLFNFKYADGAQMLSLGGVIGGDLERDRLQSSGVYNLSFVTTGDDPIRVSVPPLTIREKQWLDQRLEAVDSADDLEFELDQELLDHFLNLYRHYPTYYETLV